MDCRASWQAQRNMCSLALSPLTGTRIRLASNMTPDTQPPRLGAIDVVKRQRQIINTGCSQIKDESGPFKKNQAGQRTTPNLLITLGVESERRCVESAIWRGLTRGVNSIQLELRTSLPSVGTGGGRSRAKSYKWPTCSLVPATINTSPGLISSSWAGCNT